jgi:hypothetical protein
VPRCFILVGSLVLALGACGQSADLKPAPGHPLPVAPYGRGDRPTAEDLLVPQPQASPERSVELRKRSEKRTDDPFDLPPDEGTSVPASPASPAPTPSST